MVGWASLDNHFIWKRLFKSHVCFADSHDKCCYCTGREAGTDLSRRSTSREGSRHMGGQAGTHTQVLEGPPPSLCVNSDTRPSPGLVGTVATAAPGSGEVDRIWGAGGRAFLLGMALLDAECPFPDWNFGPGERVAPCKTAFLAVTLLSLRSN